MREGRDLLLREAEELVADHAHRIVEAGLSVEHRAFMLGQIGGDAGTNLAREPLFDESSDRRRPERARVVIGKAQSVRPNDLGLAHGDAAHELG